MSEEAVNKEVEVEEAAPTKEGGGLNGAFLLIYRVCAVLVVLSFVVLTVIAIIDVIAYHIGEASQRAKLFTDPNLMLSKTTDVQVLQYVHNSPEKEPFSIFTEQSIISTVYVIVGLAVVTLGVQLGIFFALKLYHTVRSPKTPFTEKISIPFHFMGVLLVAFVGVVILNIMYKQTFIKKTQPELKTLRSRLRDIKSYIYRNLNNDTRFLQALKSGDVDNVVAIMKRNTKNQLALSKMMFTFNLYTFFTSQIPETDRAFDSINSMFTNEGMRTQKVDPAMLFYYKRPLFVPNLYPSIRADLQAAIGVGERNFMTSVGVLMKELNKRLLTTQSIGEGKVTVRDYMWKVMTVSLLMTAILVIMMLIAMFEGILPQIIGMMRSFFSRKEN